MPRNLHNERGNKLEDLDNRVKAVLGHMETTLDTKRVTGEPIEIGEYTIIPLISIGFGFGVGSGTGKSEEFIKGEGVGGASAGGGGLKPVGVVVIGPEGVKIEYLKGNTASLLETLAANISIPKSKKGDKD